MGGGRGHVGGASVVVAAGDELARRLLLTVLDHEGWQVEEAADHADLVGRALDTGAIAVVVDTRLADAPGPDAPVRSLRRSPATAALVVVLLVADPAEVPAGVAAGADAVLTTPFSPLELAMTLEDLLGPPGPAVSA